MAEKMQLQLSAGDFAPFFAGQAQDAYRLFGCHFLKEENAWRFCVYAPHAKAVSVVGEWNRFEEKRNPLKKLSDGVFAGLVTGPKEGESYQYCITTQGGRKLWRSDPFARQGELRPGSASRFSVPRPYAWSDGAYIKKRAGKKWKELPISIYELHLSSWRRGADGGFLNYRELAGELCAYLAQMEYTHVLLLPVCQHYSDASAGFHATGYYAIDPRHGTPEDFRFLVDRLHSMGVGVLLSWQLAGFSQSPGGLACFDGGCVYEPEDASGEKGLLPFDFARPAVRSFLLSNAAYLFSEYHIDGLCVGNPVALLGSGAESSAPGLEFLRNLHRMLAEQFPGVLAIARAESSSPLLTQPLEEGGLGFCIKWNTRSAKDMCSALSLSEVERERRLRLPLFSAFYGQRLLAFGHDAPPLPENLAMFRALLTYQFAQPGKKLLFMGRDFAAPSWDFSDELPWALLGYEAHEKMQRFVGALNHLYQKSRPLYQLDGSREGFGRLPVECPPGTFAFLRKAKKWGGRRKQMLCAFNFSDAPADFSLPLSGAETLCLALDTEQRKFGGAGLGAELKIEGEQVRFVLSDHSAALWDCERDVP